MSTNQENVQIPAINTATSGRKESRGEIPTQAGPSGTADQVPMTEALRRFLDNYYEDRFVTFPDFDPRGEHGLPQHKYMCEVYSRSRTYKTMKLTHCVVGDVRNDLAACTLQKLTQELLEEREKEKEAPWKLFNYVTEKYKDFEVVRRDVFLQRKVKEGDKDAIKSKRYSVEVRYNPDLPDFNKYGAFCLTRAQGYNYNQASQKAYDLLIFKEQNDLLYMNEYVPYFAPEPLYFDKKYRKDLLSLISKGSHKNVTFTREIPEVCRGNAINSALTRRNSIVSLPDIPSSPAEAVKAWFSAITSPIQHHTLVSTPVSSAATTPTSEIPNPFSRSFSTLGAKLSSASNRRHRDNVHQEAPTLAKELEEKRKPPKAEKKGSTSKTSAAATSNTASSVSKAPGTSHASSTASSNIRPSSADSNVVKRVEKQEAENQEKIERSGTHRKLQLDSPKKLIDRIRPKSQGHTTTSSREGGSTSTTSKEIKGSSKPITKSKTRTTDNNSKSETTTASTHPKQSFSSTATVPKTSSASTVSTSGKPQVVATPSKPQGTSAATKSHVDTTPSKSKSSANTSRSSIPTTTTKSPSPSNNSSSPPPSSEPTAPASRHHASSSTSTTSSSTTQKHRKSSPQSSPTS